MRYFIEAVKQNIVDEECAKRFHDFVVSAGEESIILGCTELPVLYGECLRQGLTFTGKRIFDPLQSTINILVSLHKE